MGYDKLDLIKFCREKKTPLFNENFTWEYPKSFPDFFLETHNN